MAQDFYRAFQLGGDETTISTVDTAGVTIAAIQAIHANHHELVAKVEKLQASNTQKDARIVELKKQLEELADSLTLRISTVEQQLANE